MVIVQSGGGSSLTTAASSLLKWKGNTVAPKMLGFKVSVIQDLNLKSKIKFKNLKEVKRTPRKSILCLDITPDQSNQDGLVEYPGTRWSVSGGRKS